MAAVSRGGAAPVGQTQDVWRGGGAPPLARGRRAHRWAGHLEWGLLSPAGRRIAVRERTGASGAVICRGVPCATADSAARVRGARHDPVGLGVSVIENTVRCVGIQNKWGKHPPPRCGRRDEADIANRLAQTERNRATAMRGWRAPTPVAARRRFIGSGPVRPARIREPAGPPHRQFGKKNPLVHYRQDPQQGCVDVNVHKRNASKARPGVACEIQD